MVQTMEEYSVHAQSLTCLILIKFFSPIDIVYHVKFECPSILQHDMVKSAKQYSVDAHKLLKWNFPKLFNSLDMVKRCFMPRLNVLVCFQPPIWSSACKNIMSMHTSMYRA